MRRRKDAGFSLAALIFFAAAASILAAAAVPAYQMQAQREQEEELIFRGQEYMRAIQKYQRKFGIYPPTIDALLETNGIRFLRREYLDPITGEEFRLITINADGSVSGSTVLNQRVNNVPLFGAAPQVFGQQPQTGSSSQPQPGSNPQSLPGFSSQQSGFGQQPQSGFSPQQQLGFGQQPQSGFGQQAPRTPSGNNTGGQTRGGIQSQQRTGNSNVLGGTGGIIGVASTSEATSLKVYNTRQKYNEWEFIAILGQGQSGPATGNPAPGRGGANTTNPAQSPQNPAGQAIQ